MGTLQYLEAQTSTGKESSLIYHENTDGRVYLQPTHQDGGANYCYLTPEQQLELADRLRTHAERVLHARNTAENAAIRNRTSY